MSLFQDLREDKPQTYRLPKKNFFRPLASAIAAPRDLPPRGVCRVLDLASRVGGRRCREPPVAASLGEERCAPPVSVDLPSQQFTDNRRLHLFTSRSIRRGSLSRSGFQDTCRRYVVISRAMTLTVQPCREAPMPEGGQDALPGHRKSWIGRWKAYMLNICAVW